MRKMSLIRLVREEKGSAMILTVIAMVALMGFAALAIDGGKLYSRHTRLQDIADSCALAGCMELITAEGSNTEKKNDAVQKVEKYAEKHGLTVDSQNGYTLQVSHGDDESGTLTVSFPDGIRKTRVDIDMQTDLMFARVFSMNDTTVGVSATAKNGPSTGDEDLIPVAFFWPKDEGEDYIPGTLYELTLKPGEASSGNFGFLDFKPSSMFDEYLINGYSGPLEENILTYTGASSGQADKIHDRLDLCECGASNLSPDGHEPDCPRFVTIPIIDNFFEANGKKYVHVAGLARFYIIDYNKKDKMLSGIFIQDASGSHVGDGEAPNFIQKAVCLVD